MVKIRGSRVCQKPARYINEPLFSSAQDRERLMDRNRKIKRQIERKTDSDGQSQEGHTDVRDD